MSENEEKQTSEEVTDSAGVKLEGLFATKQGMGSIYNSDGKIVPVTVLKVDPWVVSQV